MADNLTRAGATDLAMRIAKYWHSRKDGRHVEVVVVPLGFRDNKNGQSYGVRTNLDAGGNPPTRPTPIRKPGIEEQAA